jgi:hypothetical protein
MGDETDVRMCGEKRRQYRHAETCYLPNSNFSGTLWCEYSAGAHPLRDRAVVNGAAKASPPSGFHPSRTIMYRSPGALGKAARAVGPNAITPAFPGAARDRSRDRTRSRVPPLRVGAMLTLLRVHFSAPRPGG